MFLMLTDFSSTVIFQKIIFLMGETVWLTAFSPNHFSRVELNHDISMSMTVSKRGLFLHSTWKRSRSADPALLSAVTSLLCDDAVCPDS